MEGSWKGRGVVHGGGLVERDGGGDGKEWPARVAWLVLQSQLGKNK